MSELKKKAPAKKGRPSKPDARVVIREALSGLGELSPVATMEEQAAYVRELVKRLEAV